MLYGGDGNVNYSKNTMKMQRFRNQGINLKIMPNSKIIDKRKNLHLAGFCGSFEYFIFEQSRLSLSQIIKKERKERKGGLLKVGIITSFRVFACKYCAFRWSISLTACACLVYEFT